MYREGGRGSFCAHAHVDMHELAIPQIQKNGGRSRAYLIKPENTDCKVSENGRVANTAVEQKEGDSREG